MYFSFSGSMAVEAGHLCLFPPQIITNGDMVTANNNIYPGWGAPMGYELLPGTAAVGGGGTTLVPPVYGAATLVDSFPVKAAIKSDSGLTYSIPSVAAVSRKRSRDSIGIADHHHQFMPFPQQSGSSLYSADALTFLGQDLSLLIHQQQFEIDRLIAQHAAKMRMEMEESRKSYSRSLMTAVKETVMKKLRAKEVQIEKMGKLNSALEERVKSLGIENQLWRQMAESNEAIVNALRINLDQALVAHEHRTEAEADDAQSSSSSCGINEFPKNGDVKELQRENGGGVGGGERGRLCRKCGKEEACLLLLPCRHLCVCVGCGAALHTCPICLCSMNTSLHVNWSS